MTRLQFLAYIQQTLKRTDKDTEIYQALNDTIADIASRGKFMDYSFQSYTQTVVGQVDYSLPTTLLQLQDPVRLLEGNASGDTGWNLVKVDKETFDEYEPTPYRTDPVCGRSIYYCIYANQILLTPIPDLVYLLEINWGIVPAKLQQDIDASAFSSIWDEIVKFGVIFRMWEVLGMYQDAQYWQARYEAGVARMLSNNKDKTGGIVSIGAVNNF